jgi:hypothetical protein
VVAVPVRKASMRALEFVQAAVARRATARQIAE